LPRSTAKARVRSRAVIAILIAGAIVAGACKSTPKAPALPTTTVPSTTTTTLASTLDPSFHTRVKGALTVATDHDEPPWFVADGRSYIDGFEYGVARMIANRLGLAVVRVVHGSLQSIIHGYDCRCDLFLGSVSVSEALARSVDLSVPYVATDLGVLVKIGAAIPTATTAKLLRWGTEFGNNQASELIDSEIQPTVPSHTYARANDVVAAVASGAVDAGLLETPTALLAAQTNPNLAVVGRFPTGGGWAAVLPLGSENTPSLNHLLESLNDDGTLGFIRRRYLGVDPTAVPRVAGR
jgi:ABC-type amino acid transport substrate-binding protein